MTRLSLDEIRANNPEFDYMNNDELITALHSEYAPKEDFKSFSKSMGYEQSKLVRGVKSFANMVEKTIPKLAAGIGMYYQAAGSKAKVPEEDASYKVGKGLIDWASKYKTITPEPSKSEQQTISGKVGSTFGSLASFMAVAPARTLGQLGMLSGQYYLAISEEKPDWSEKKKTEYAVQQGVVATAMEKAGVSYITAPFKGMGKQLVKGAIKDSSFFGLVKGAVSGFAKGYAVEGSEEGAQQWSQNGIDKAYKLDRGLMDGVVESVIYGGLAGGSIRGVGSISLDVSRKLKARGMTDSEISNMEQNLTGIVNNVIEQNPEQHKEAQDILKSGIENKSHDELIQAIQDKGNTYEEAQAMVDDMNPLDIETVNEQYKATKAMPELSPLHQEALNYGSAEEFMKTKLYSSVNDILEYRKSIKDSMSGMTRTELKGGGWSDNGMSNRAQIASLNMVNEEQLQLLLKDYTGNDYSLDDLRYYGAPDEKHHVGKDLELKGFWDIDVANKEDPELLTDQLEWIKNKVNPTTRGNSLTDIWNEARSIAAGVENDVLTVPYYGDDMSTAESRQQNAGNRELYYEQLLAQQGDSLLDRVKESAGDLSKSASEWANKAFVPLSTRLKNINVKLKYVIRSFEYKSLQQHKNRVEQIKPFLESFSKLSVEDGIKLDYALKNSDMAMIDSIVKKNNMEESFANVKKMLEEVYDDAESVKLDIGYLENYFPRRIKDPENFMSYMRGTENWTRIEEELKLKDPMNEMSLAERAEYISTMLRGFGGDKAMLARPSFTKYRRIIELTPEMNKYYKHSTQAIIDYVRAMSEIIEARKLFGKSETEIESSIGAVVDNMIQDGDIDFKDEKKAKEILISRFNQKGTRGLWSLYKDINYMTLLGSPISSITQIEDLAVTMYKSGLFNATKGLIQSITGKGITQGDLGIENIASEFQDKTVMGSVIEKLFKVTGFSFMDKLGKESFINGVYMKYQQQAKNPSERFIEMLDNIFGEESQQVLDDLKNGNLTDDVKYLLFNELAEIQPITISEMPEYYVTGGNLRLLYALKSFTIKRLDFLRNTVIDEIQADPIKGTGNLIRLAMCLIVMGATTDFIKDFILGRDVEPEEMLLNNIFKMFGFGKWMLYTARREGLGKAFANQILPTKLIDDVYKDIITKKDIMDLRTISNVPVAGKFWYWWFGGGSDEAKQRSKEARKQRSKPKAKKSKKDK